MSRLHRWHCGTLGWTEKRGRAKARFHFIPPPFLISREIGARHFVHHVAHCDSMRERENERERERERERDGGRESGWVSSVREPLPPPPPHPHPPPLPPPLSLSLFPGGAPPSLISHQLTTRARWKVNSGIMGFQYRPRPQEDTASHWTIGDVISPNRLFNFPQWRHSTPWTQTVGLGTAIVSNVIRTLPWPTPLPPVPPFFFCLPLHTTLLPPSSSPPPPPSLYIFPKTRLFFLSSEFPADKCWREREREGKNCSVLTWCVWCLILNPILKKFYVAHNSFFKQSKERVRSDQIRLKNQPLESRMTRCLWDRKESALVAGG